MPRRLEGKVAVVTGGGRGIGRAVALALSAQGANIVVNDLGTSAVGQGYANEPAETVAAAIRASGGRAVADSGDVSSRTAAEELINAAVAEFGRLDILVNVAGIARENMVYDMTEDEWDDVIRVHLKGTFNTTHFASHVWRRQGSGRLINFSSAGGVFGVPGISNYAAAKAGIIGFTYTCANELAPFNVTANAICPVAWTRLFDWWFESRQSRGWGVSQEELAVQDRGERLEDAASGTERDPAHVAPIIVYLSSDEAAHVTGRVFAAGGRSIGLYARPSVESTLFTDDAEWDIDRLFALFPQTLGAGMAAAPPAVRG